MVGPAVLGVTEVHGADVVVEVTGLEVEGEVDDVDVNVRETLIGDISTDRPDVSTVL